MSSGNQEGSSPLAVSALRSKFEKLAHENLPASATSTKPSSSTTSLPRHPETELLSPIATRQRALSNVEVDPGSNATPAPAHHIRTSSSSSDLKVGRRPPPPPPPRSPKPTGSPVIKPVPSTNSSVAALNKTSLINRKPPPPPTPVQNEETTGAGGAPPGGVASLRSKFAMNGVAGPSSPSSRPIQVPGIRAASHSSTISPSQSLKSLEISQTNHRHSVSSLPNNGPLICFDDVEESKPSAPPVPSRSPSNPFESDSSDRSSRTTSVESSSSSQTSPELIQRPPPPPPSPSKHSDIRPPPPRHASLPLHAIETSGSSNPDSQDSSSTGSGTPTLQVPPSLPVRRSPPKSVRDLPVHGRPPLRMNTMQEAEAQDGYRSAPPTLERKTQFAPPPIRTIGLGDKLPPPRRPPSNEGSESESAEEDETKGPRAADALPDASHSSRRPPLPGRHELARARIPVIAHTGVIAVAGAYVITAHHHIKVYDLSRSSDTYIYNIDLKDAGFDWRGKDPRVTSLEFRSADNDTDRGRFLWVGTKDGSIWELDVPTGSVTTVRYAAHSAAVTHIFRHGLHMVSLDENGKVLVFTPDSDIGGCAVMLTNSSPRVVRITEKQGFAKILGGLLWTSGGPGSSGSAQTNGTSARGPAIRVYTIFSHAHGGKSLLPADSVGAVTSGTVLQSQPGKVFLGHEGGFITIWNLESDEGMPCCTEVVKISASDVLCLEGVGDRLWAGGRKGMINAYDVQWKPWVITNSWMAHSELPVHSLLIDPFSIEKYGQLSVISVGRDEVARFWDGLLAVNWIDNELSKRESSFSTFRPLTVLVVSWNVDAAKPDTLTGCPENANFFDDVLNSVESPDIIVFGFQELIDLESRKMAAKTVLLGGKKKAPDGSISEKVSRSYKMWHDRLAMAVRLAMPPDCPYTVVHAENLVGLFSCIFIKSSERKGLKDIAITTVKRGIGGMYGNKGGIVARFAVDDSSICFINCHLAAGQNHVRARNSDIAAILDEKEVFPPSLSDLDNVAYAGGGDGTMVLDHEFVFLNGDLNYRIDQRRDATIAAVQSSQIEFLLQHDQLLKEMRYNRSFRLHIFIEAPITFPPTYKYDRRSSEYDTSEKSRAPAWCDRILYRTRNSERVQNLHYRRYEANVSDHRPISAAFRVTVKSVDHGARSRAKEEVEYLWLDQQTALLSAARTFFVEQAII
ncbi:hypothetical protein ACEPAH_6262 [Sanghuangporus vaninii]